MSVLNARRITVLIIAWCMVLVVIEVFKVKPGTQQDKDLVAIGGFLKRNPILLGLPVHKVDETITMKLRSVLENANMVDGVSVVVFNNQCENKHDDDEMWMEKYVKSGTFKIICTTRDNHEIETPVLMLNEIIKLRGRYYLHVDSMEGLEVHVRNLLSTVAVLKQRYYLDASWLLLHINPKRRWFSPFSSRTDTKSDVPTTLDGMLMRLSDVSSFAEYLARNKNGTFEQLIPSYLDERDRLLVHA